MKTGYKLAGLSCLFCTVASGALSILSLKIPPSGFVQSAFNAILASVLGVMAYRYFKKAYPDTEENLDTLSNQ